MTEAIPDVSFIGVGTKNITNEKMSGGCEGLFEALLKSIELKEEGADKEKAISNELKDEEANALNCLYQLILMLKENAANDIDLNKDLTSKQGNATIATGQNSLENIFYNLDTGDLSSGYVNDMVNDYFTKHKVNLEAIEQFWASIGAQLPQLEAIDKTFLEEKIKLLLKKPDKMLPCEENIMDTIDNETITKGLDQAFEVPASEIKDENFDLYRFKENSNEEDMKIVSPEKKDFGEKEQILSRLKQDKINEPEFAIKHDNNLNPQNQGYFEGQTFTNNIKSNGDAAISETVSLPQFNTEANSEVVEQIVDKVRLAVKGPDKELSVSLKPDYLGKVLIKVISDENGMKAKLFIENNHVREIMQSSLQDLKDQVKQQNMNLADINIYEMSDNWQSGSFDQNFSRRDNYSPYKRAKFRQSEEVDEIEHTYTRNAFDRESSINYVI